MGAEQFGAAIRHAGMGVHNAARQLDQLADVPHQQYLCKLLRSGHIQRIPIKLEHLTTGMLLYSGRFWAR